jgi:hypothetical protein
MVVVVGAVVGGLAVSSSGSAASPTNRVRWKGSNWFLVGANLPWNDRDCDFGCRGQGGVLDNKLQLDRDVKILSRKGIRVVRWYLFADDAWQIKRNGSNVPTGLATRKLYADLDAAVDIAERHDVYLQFVLFADLAKVPSTWVTDPTQRDDLGNVLGPMFHRYKSNRHVMSWEVADEPEHVVDGGTFALADVQQFVRRIAGEVHQQSNAHATLGESGIDRVALWNGLNLDYHSPHWWSANTSGPSCATCHAASSLGADGPVVIGATDMSQSAATATIAALRSRSYAGVLAWSRYKKQHPSLGSETPSVPFDSIWRFTYANSFAGPRSKLLNPCLGPSAGKYRCPNLQMSKPSNVFLGHKHGKTVLFSRNSLNSVGDGPASIHGKRNGHFTMRAEQVLYRKHGRPIHLATGAKLFFKAVPGQYRYWKWNGAATMELWQLDGEGNPTRLMRRGPKTIYCLRDLERTHGYLKGSPGGRVFPGCSQNLHQQEVTLGTSVGWSDIYPSTYNENWIDVTGLRGCYAYVHVVDPTDAIFEKSEDDNRSQVVVRLPFTGSNAGCPRATRIPTAVDASAY